MTHYSYIRDWIYYHFNPFRWFLLFFVLLLLFLPVVFIFIYWLAMWIVQSFGFNDVRFLTATAIFVPVMAGVVGYAWHWNRKSSLQRYSALVKLEIVLNGNYSNLSTVIDSLQEHIEAGRAFINPLFVDIPQELLYQLGRIDIINQTFGLMNRFQRLTHDLRFMKEVWQNIYSSHGSNYTKALTDPEHKALLQQYPKILMHARDMLKELESCLIDVRFFIENDKPWSQHLSFYSRHKLEHWRVEDIKRFHQEVKDCV